MLNLKSGLKKIVRRLGYEVRRLPGARPAAASAPLNCWNWLHDTLRVGTVIDIGANNGEFAAFLIKRFRPRQVLLFEPLAVHLPALKERFGAAPGYQIFPTALGERQGTATFFHNSYDPASSLLRVSKHSTQPFPQTSGETREEVPIARLDDLVDPAALDRDVFIKIDVQGVEDRVIRGGRKVFEAARCVHIEASFVPMYEGQVLFEEVHALLAELGFRLAGFKNQIDSPLSGQPLFAHCFYLR